MGIARGYVPLKKIDFNIMANRRTLAKMGFPEAEIAKVEAGLKARKQVSGSIKRTYPPHLLNFRNTIFRNLTMRIGRLFTYNYKENEVRFEPFVCDICRTLIGSGYYRRPPLPLPTPPVHMPPVPIPPGVVIDYQGLETYIVCGNCQIILHLRTTESGLLMHEIRKGFGYVDLDRIERIIKENR